MNNPLNYTDPSGYWSIDFGLIRIGDHGISNGFVTRALVKNPFLQSAGYVIAGLYGGIGGVTAYSGGSWGDAIRSAAFTAASAWVSAGIANITGEIFAPDGLSLQAQHAYGHSASLLSPTAAQRTAGLIKSIAHGLSQAGLQKLRTGSAKGAFLSAFITSGFSIGNRGNAISSTVVMIVVGGTAAVVGGGKFANGALSAMFVHMFNRLMTREEFIQENYSQDPNAQALQSALGDNAENWYGKDAPVAKTVLSIGLAAHTGGKFFASQLQKGLLYFFKGLEQVYYNEFVSYGAGALTGAGLGGLIYYGTGEETAKPSKALIMMDKE